MALQYDKRKLAEWRKRAITDLSQIVVGKTYYANIYPREFTVAAIISNLEAVKRFSPIPPNREDVDDPDALESVLTEDGQVLSIKDHNVGASYNPWLWFSSPEDRDACVKEFEIWMSPSDYVDYD